MSKVNLTNHKFDGVEIKQAKTDSTFPKGFKVPRGYVCLTDLTKLEKRFRWSEYTAQARVKESLAVLSEMLGIPQHELVKKNAKLGVWVHELVFLDVAASLNPRIKYWALQTFRLTGQGRLVAADENDKEAVETSNKVKAEYEGLKKLYDELEDENIAHESNCFELSSHAKELSHFHANLHDLLKAIVFRAISVEDARRLLFTSGHFADTDAVLAYSQRDMNFEEIPGVMYSLHSDRTQSDLAAFIKLFHEIDVDLYLKSLKVVDPQKADDFEVRVKTVGLGT